MSVLCGALPGSSLSLVVFGRHLLIPVEDDKCFGVVAFKPVPHASCEVSHGA